MTVLYQAEIDGKEIEITRQDLEALDIESTTPGEYHVLRKMQGFNIKVLYADHIRKEYKLLVGDKEVTVNLKDSVEIQVHDMGLDAFVSSHSGDVTAPMPGLVLEVNVKVGDNVKSGDQLIILEAMKMQNVLSSPVDGVVAEVYVKQGQPVDKSQILVSFE